MDVVSRAISCGLDMQFKEDVVNARKLTRGFTLVEIMIVVAIVAILAAIAVPSYRDYMIRTRLTDAFSALSTAAASAEQFWNTNRTYVNFNASRAWPANTSYFIYTADNLSPSTYRFTATGVAGSRVDGFAFTIDHNGTRTTTSIGANWSAPAGVCWVSRNGACLE